MSIVKCIVTAGMAFLLLGCAANQYDRQRPMEGFQPEKVSVPEYRDFLAALTAAVEDGRPRELNTIEQRRFEEVNVRLDRMLASVDDVEEFNEDERVQLLNLHADLEEVVLGAADQQIICQRRHRVGSHFKSTECKTRAEWRADRERAAELMRQIYLSEQIAPAEPSM